MVRAIEWRREQPALPGSRRPHLLGWLDGRRQREADEFHVSEMARRWRATCYGAGLGEDTESCAGIVGAAFPEVRSIVLGADADRLLVQLIPGQLVKDFKAKADRLASGMGVPRIRVKERPGGRGFAIVELLKVDPLAQPVMLPIGASWAEHRILLLGCETGEELSVSLLDVAHVIAQGQTRSGKSRWTYGVLAQLAGCRDVLIGGSDVTGLVSRAFDGTRHAGGWASGSADLEQHARVLEQAVAEMDRRNAAMPAMLDVFPTSVQDPLRFIVIEELAGLIEAAESIDAMRERGVAKLSARIKGAYKRLMAEGAKAGFRVLILVQRAEAGIIGGFARGQASLRLSFRVDDAESVKMLHPGVDPVTAAEHAVAAAAIALVSGPELPLTRGRAPHMPDYATFVQLVQEQSRQLRIVSGEAAA